MAEWWEAAPLADAAPDAGQWWADAPLADAPAADYGNEARREALTPVSRRGTMRGGADPFVGGDAPNVITGGGSGKRLVADPRRTDAPKRYTDADIPEMTAGSLARDAAAGVLQIGPTVMQGIGDITRLATGDRAGVALSREARRGTEAIQEVVGSERAMAQRKKLAQDMADPNVSISEALADNKAAVADQILPTIGSMFLPVGAAGATGKLATVGKGALSASERAAIAGATTTPAVIATTVGQNAGDTYSQVRDAGASQEDAYKGAAVAGAATLVAGKLTGGAADSAAARALLGQGAAREGARGLVQGVAREGGQEVGEQLGQSVGEAVGKGEELDPLKIGKEAAVAGVLGAVVGGGVTAATSTVPEAIRDRQLKAAAEGGDVEAALVLAAERKQFTQTPEASAAAVLQTDSVDQAIATAQAAVNAPAPPPEQRGTDTVDASVAEFAKTLESPVPTAPQGSIADQFAAQLDQPAPVAEQAPPPAAPEAPQTAMQLAFQQATERAKAAPNFAQQSAAPITQPGAIPAPNQTPGVANAQPDVQPPAAVAATPAVGGSDPAMGSGMAVGRVATDAGRGDAPPAAAIAPSVQPPAPVETGRVGDDAAVEPFRVAGAGPTKSWVIREKATGAVIMETFDPKKVAALNTAKYEAVPIAQHLASLNKPASVSQLPAAPALAPNRVDSLRDSPLSRVEDAPAERFPHVESFTDVNVGPGGTIRPRAVAADKPTYRETDVGGLDDLMRSDQQAGAYGGFVTDNPDLAIGQGGNRGVHVVFRPNSISGRENQKPGTSDLTGREYRADMIAPRAVQSITMPAAEASSLRGLTKQRLRAEFEQESMPDGSIRFRRKGMDDPGGPLFSRAEPPRAIPGPRPIKPTPEVSNTAPFEFTQNPTGTVTVKGDADAIRARFPELKSIRVPGGVTFGRSSAAQVVAALSPQYTQSDEQSPAGTEPAAANVLRGADAAVPAEPPAGSLRVLNLGVAKSARGAGADSVHPYVERSVPGDAELRAIASAFGERYQGFDLRPDLLDAQRRQYGFFNGAYVDGTIYLRATGNDRPHLSVLGHEMAHRMASSQPALYAEFVEAVRPYIDQTKYAREFTKTAVAKDVKNDDLIREEFMGEVLSDAFMDPGFWEALGQKSPTLLKRVADMARALINRVFSKVGYSKRSERYTTDFRKVIEISAGVMARYGGKAADDSGGVRFQTAGPRVGRSKRFTQGVPEETKVEAARRVGQDQHIRMRTLREWADANGVPMGAASNVYMTEERMHGRAATRIQDFREKTIQPLVKLVQKSGFTIDRVAEYLHAQHAEERNIQVAKINKALPDGGSGMLTADAKKILAGAPQSLKLVAAQFQQITTKTRDTLLKGGIISQEMADAWDAAYKNYVPLKGGDEAPSQRVGTGPGLSVQGKQKRALGHTERDDGEHIVENILRDHERAIMLVEKNRVGQSMMLWLNELNDPRIGTVGKPEKRGVLKPSYEYEVRVGTVAVQTFNTEAQAKDFIVQQTATNAPGASSMKVRRSIADQNVQYMASPQLAENEAQVYVAGHAIRLQLNDPLLARSYKKLGADQMSRLLAVSRQINGYLSKAYTGYNPAFIVRNLIRDFGTGMVNIAGNHGAGIAAKAVANYPASLLSMLRYSWNGNSTPDIDAYREHGGSTGAAWLSDIERIGADMQADFEKYQGVMLQLQQGKPGKAAKAAAGKMLHWAVGWIEHLNNATENAMRLAVFKAVRDETGSVEEAASAAKNSTVNFNRRGEMGQTLGAMYLFFNPSVQGSTALIETLTRGKHKAQAWTMVGAMVGAAYAMAQLQFGGDDEDQERWKKISPETRNRNMIIRIAQDKYLTIPAPFGLGFFHALGNAIFDVQHGESANKVSIGLASNFLDNFSPIGNPLQGSRGWDKIDAKGFVQLLPGVPGTGELSRDVVRQAVNKNSFGSEIVPDSKFDEDKPDFLKMFRSTKGTVYDRVAKGMSDATGGTDTRAGKVDVSPESLKYWQSTLLGGSGTFWIDTFQLGALAGLALWNPDDPDKGSLMPENREIPIYRDYVKDETIQDSRRAFWEAAREAETALKGFQRSAKAGDFESMTKSLSEDAELIMLAKASHGFAAMVKAHRDQVDALKADENASLAFKRMSIREMDKKEASLYDQYLGMVTEQTKSREQRLKDEAAAKRQ